MSATLQNPPSLQWSISLEWEENGQLKTQEIFQQQTKNGEITVGRADCDVKLNHMSVSKVHVEIRFDLQQQRFFIKNLSPQNLSLIDEKELEYNKEFGLNENSIITLGEQNLKVNSIVISTLPSTDYSFKGTKGRNSSTSSVISPSAHPNQANSNPISSQVNPNQNSHQVNPSPSEDDKKKSCNDKVIVTAIIAATATIMASGITALSSYYVSKNTANPQIHQTKGQTNLRPEK
ncbi:FHA domain-containing protein [Mastigocladopsis repens]|uniref:FHA domain-containing protein n=1 Tax=Mastigocladopsis repens TaxID=221287 RepID=UPI000314C697|nr:FHA domain-containing protein [Mastigocladopsis repens]